ncbi:MAG TPA: hypothetical protein V6D14_23380 [Coleofasciculaceae cyanobacterium]
MPFQTQNPPGVPPGSGRERPKPGAVKSQGVTFAFRDAVSVIDSYS